MHPYLTERMLQPVADARAARARSRSSTGSGSTARDIRAGCPAAAISTAGAHPGGGRRLPVDARAAAVPARARRRTRPRPTAGARCGPAGSTATPSRPCSARPAIGRSPPQPAGGADRRERSRYCAWSPGACRAREIAEQLRHLAEDGAQPHRAHLRQDRGGQPRRGQPVRGRARAPARRLRAVPRRVKARSAPNKPPKQGGVDRRRCRGGGRGRCPEAWGGRTL